MNIEEIPDSELFNIQEYFDYLYSLGDADLIALFERAQEIYNKDPKNLDASDDVSIIFTVGRDRGIL